VAVIGSGTLGLLTIAAVAALSPGTTLVAAAKHPHQKQLARDLGAEVVCEPQELARVLRSRTGSWVVDDRLTGGAAEVVDCVGSGDTLQQALDVVGPGGTVHAVGMPGVTTLDLTGLWHREINLRGCYAYHHDDFATAVGLVATSTSAGWCRPPTLARYEDAIRHAAEAGRRGAVKVAFDLAMRRKGTDLTMPRPVVLNVDKSTPPILCLGEGFCLERPGRAQLRHLPAGTSRRPARPGRRRPRALLAPDSEPLPELLHAG
jgi:NADPH:quinone reductase-like Zn-dependent oxidoreductase